MCGKLFTIVIVLIAIVMGLLAVFIPPEHTELLIEVSKFFDIMLPVLAVGALLKYLCSCPANCKCACCKKSESAATDKCR